MAKFVKLTRTDHQPVWVMGSAVERISATVPGDGPAAARTTVSVGGVTQHVIEEPNIVASMVEQADG